MMSEMKFGLSPGSNVEEFESWFGAWFENISVCVQDTVHIGTKMRNRLLNSSIVLYMGNQIASIIHMKMLLEKLSKEVHGLTWSDILPEDRQNYASLEKLMQPRVINALEKNVVDCDSTVMYLKLCKQITSSYLDVDLEQVERIYRIWHAAYFLRSWRIWIQSKENEHTLTENFVSRNMFLCVELNAHALVYLIRRLRANRQTDLFIPSKFASQPCEFIFRQMRSMGTVNFTKINFTLYELVHMISRVELSNKIIHSHKQIRFPRIELKQLQGVRNIVLPSDQQILDAMKQARRDALQNSAKFGMNSEEDAITNFDTSLLTELKGAKNKNTEREYFIEDSSDGEEQGEESYGWAYGDMNVIDQLFNVEAGTQADTSNPKTCTSPGDNADISSLASGSKDCTNPGVNQSENVNNQTERKNFVEIIYPDGTVRNMRKSTFVWQLLDNNKKLSSDRLKRVQGSSNITEPKKKQQKTASASTEHRKEDQISFKATDIEIGEWAIFKINDEFIISQQNSKEFLKENCLFGIILGFKSIGSKGRPIQYKKNSAKTPCNEEYQLNLQVLGAWHICDENGKLTTIENKKKFNIYMKNFIATIKTTITTQNDNSPENLKLSYEIPCEFSELTTLLSNHFSDSFSV